MKRLFTLLLIVTVLMGLTACGGTKPTVQPSVQIEPLVYESLPTALKAEKIGTIDRMPSTAAGGLYYQEDGLYGIMSFDGKHDTGAIYTVCQPKGNYFLVMNQAETSKDDVTTLNRAGLVDGNGNEIVPLEYAVVEVLGSRFVRVVSVDATTENEEEKLTYYTDGDKKVLCTGTWYIYDLETGEKVKNATGSKPYINFDCGGYVKYVLDDKTVITATPDGKVLPNEVVHLNNGHYAIAAENTVYTSEGDKLFTYDPNGYVPRDSKGVSGYIVASKKVDGKDKYVLLDLEGKVASAEFDSQPMVMGQLLFVSKKLVTFDGKAVIDGEFDMASWESKYGQMWVVIKGQIRKAVDINGNVLYEGNTTNPVMDIHEMMCYKKNEVSRDYYCVADKNFSFTGVGMSPYVVKTPDGETAYKLVNVLSGETILSGHMNYRVADPDNSVLYVYAQVSETEIEVYAVR